jgi:hypothetical protein
MKPVPDKGSFRPDFELSNGAFGEVKAGIDVNGKPVIKSLRIYFPDQVRKLPEGGISQKILKEIDLNLEITKQIAKGSQFASKRTLNRMIELVNEGFTRSGRTLVSEETYAALAFLYVEACKSHPGSPNTYLADQFGIERGTLIARIAKAKKIGVLEYQIGDKPSGRAGAKLSDLGEKLIEEIKQGGKN